MKIDVLDFLSDTLLGRIKPFISFYFKDGHKKTVLI